jgi:hypothetical protein
MIPADRSLVLRIVPRNLRLEEREANIAFPFVTSHHTRTSTSPTHSTFSRGPFILQSGPTHPTLLSFVTQLVSFLTLSRPPNEGILPNPVTPCHLRLRPFRTPS